MPSFAQARSSHESTTRIRSRRRRIRRSRVPPAPGAARQRGGRCPRRTPSGTRDRAGIVVQEREQVGLAATDPRPVQRIHVQISFGRPASNHPTPPARPGPARGQPGPGDIRCRLSHPAPSRAGPAGCGGPAPPNGTDFPSSARWRLEGLRRGPRLRLPRQRTTASNPPSRSFGSSVQRPAGVRTVRPPDRYAARPRLAPSAPRCPQSRPIRGLADEHVTDQPDLACSFQLGLLFIFCLRHQPLAPPPVPDGQSRRSCQAKISTGEATPVAR